MDQPKPSASTVPELGKTFASRKIQVASLAIRSSQAASQNPLFPKKQDSFRFCQQPFLSSTPSLPSQQRLAAPTTAVHPTIITTGTTSNGKTQLSLALLDLNERELLDKTWSVLVSRSDAATPTNTKSRRRVTFNDNHEFFYLPPDDADDNPDPSSEVSPDLDLDTTVEAKPPMPPLPAVSPLRPALKTNSDASRIDPISVPPKTPPKCNPDTTMPEDQHSDNGNSDATFVSPPPSVDDGATATSSSLDSPCASVASSVASSSSTSSSYTHARAIDRKGNNIARHVILDILENRSPLKSSPFMLNPAARSSSSSLTLPHPSLSTPPPTRAGPLTPAQRRLVPKDQAHSLDAIQSEINQLIERTKLSSPAPTPSTSNPIQPWPIVAPPSPPSSCPSDDPVEQQDCPDQPDDNGRQPCPIDTDPIPESVGSPDLTDQEPSVALVSSQAPSTEPSPSSSTSTSSLPDTPLPSTSTPTTTSSISQTDLSMETTLPPLLTSTHPFGSVGSSFGSTLLHEFDRISADISVDLLTSAAPQHSEESLTDRDDTSLSVSVVSSVLAQAEENPIQNENVVWHRLDKQQPPPTPPKTDMLPLDPNAQGRLYIRVIAAENLDFPIDKDGPIVKCALSDGIQVQESQHSAMGHDIHFEHDFVLENVALSVDLTLTLHAMYAEDMQTPQPATSKRRPKRTSFTSRAHDDDLARYINPQDGSLAQTRFSPGAIGVECINKVCTASFVLVNGWYRPVKRPGTSMFLGKAKRDMKSLVQEKAVGKITMELFFIPQPSSKIADLPMSMEGCEHAVNMQRFLSKVWQAGYMSQLGGDVKSWRRAYFKLKGGQLYRFSDSFHSPRAVIDLSRASGLVVDGRLVVDAQARQNLMTLVEAQDPNGILVDNQGNTSTSTIVSQATQQQIMFEQQKLFSEMYAHHPPLSPSHEAWDASSMDCLSTISISQTTTTTADSTMNGEDARLPAESDMPSYGVKNSFQLRFEDGQIIDFFTDSLDERDEWLRLFKAILGRVPKMPSWLA